MPKDYTLTFVNGVASDVQLPVGTYSYVSNTLKGYADGSIETFTVTKSSTQINLEISATGILNITVEDDLGTKIESGTLQLSNETATETYGTPVSISSGSATFENVPFDTDGITVYVDQSESDEDHDPIDSPQEVIMTASPQSDTVLNDRKKITLTVNITDKNYTGITPINGDLVVNG